MKREYKDKRVFAPRKNYYSQDESKLLCWDIEEYWRGRGYPGICAKTFLIDGEPGHWGVKTNIGPNGFPPRERAA